MPVKLERKLKRQAAKDPSIEDKDAYVYGTLRKTGWKPKREKRAEKKMSALLDDLIQFQMPHYPITSMLRRVPDPLQTYHSAGTGAAKAYAAAKSAYDIRRAHVGPFQAISGNATAPVVKGKVLKRIGIGTGTFGSGLGVGWWLGRRHEERNRELSSKLNDLIEFDLGGWRVRKTADLVGPGGRVTGNEYKSERAPGFGAAVKRNIGKVAFPAVGAVAGAALGHAGWGRARPAKGVKLTGLLEEAEPRPWGLFHEGPPEPSIEVSPGRPASMAPALIGAGAGGLAFLPAGIQADRVRQHQAVLNQLLPMAREDYMREKGIRRRPTEMSAREEPIEFGVGDFLKKMLGRKPAVAVAKKAYHPGPGWLSAGNGNWIKDPGAGPLKQSGWNREFTRKSMFSNPEKPIEFDFTSVAERLGSMNRIRGLWSGAEARAASHLGGPRDYSQSILPKRMWMQKARGESPPWKRKTFSGTAKPIEFDSGIPTDDSTATIMQPFQGATTHESKIDQLEFPAGLSPLAALQFPLPVLMRYLNQRNYLQQQFSWKQERLIQLNAKLDEIHASAHPIQ